MPEFFPQEFALGLLRLRDERERFRQQQEALREQRAFEQSIQRGQEKRAGAGEERDVAEEKRRRVTFQANQIKALKTEGVAVFDPTEDIPEFPDEELIDPITKEKRTIKTIRHTLPSGAVQMTRTGDPRVAQSLERYQLEIGTKEAQIKLTNARRELADAERAHILQKSEAIKRSGGLSPAEIGMAKDTLKRITDIRENALAALRLRAIDDKEIEAAEAAEDDPNYGLNDADKEARTNARAVEAAVLGRASRSLQPEVQERESIFGSLIRHARRFLKPGAGAPAITPVTTTPAPINAETLRLAEQAITKLEAGQPLTSEEQEAYNAAKAPK